jgi:hypothetical protein
MYAFCMMKAPFTKAVANCFNIVRHIKRTATITCSRNMPLSNHNDRRIELAIGIYYFRSGVISLVLQLEAGLHAPMPKHFHHTLSSVISYQHLSVADPTSIGYALPTFLFVGSTVVNGFHGFIEFLLHNQCWYLFLKISHFF